MLGAMHHSTQLREIPRLTVTWVVLLEVEAAAERPLQVEARDFTGTARQVPRFLWVRALLLSMVEQEALEESEAAVQLAWGYITLHLVALEVVAAAAAACKVSNLYVGVQEAAADTLEGVHPTSL